MSSNAVLNVENEQFLGQYIPIHYHHQMLADEFRMSALKAAIEIMVPLGGKVLDLGACTGALSFFAALKASKVYAVEQLPELVQYAKVFLEANGCADKVDLIETDAMTYLPPEPVDVFICEMLHAGLLREKQLEIVQSFKARYREKFGDVMPLFLPFATVMGVEPATANFSFEGFKAPIPLFESIRSPEPRSTPLGEAHPYAFVEYQDDFAVTFDFEHTFMLTASGQFNALRFLTKNVLAIIPDQDTYIDWMNQNLTLPLKTPLNGQVGELYKVTFSYAAGGQIEELQNSIEVTKV